MVLPVVALVDDELPVSFELGQFLSLFLKLCDGFLLLFDARLILIVDCFVLLFELLLDLLGNVQLVLLLLL